MPANQRVYFRGQCKNPCQSITIVPVGAMLHLLLDQIVAFTRSIPMNQKSFQGWDVGIILSRL